MRYNKKGSEMSMNVIIIAAIALLILVILAMFIFRSGRGIEDSTNCQAMNGHCMPICLEDHPVPYPLGDDSCSAGKKCCVTLGSNR